MHRTPAAPGPASPPVTTSHIPTTPKPMNVTTCPIESSRCHTHVHSLSGIHVLNAARGQLVPQAVEVQAELAASQGLAALLLLGHPGPGGGQRLAGVGARHAHHAVVVGDDRVARPDD